MADLWLTPDEVAELTARIRRPACIARDDRRNSSIRAAWR